ncbi:MAG TPA: thiamine pyrophosphate-dependent enzyme [Caldilinea sp.]|nr:thiamine pyrophosphate-dependent enzyme [Caldilinea sp.]
MEQRERFYAQMRLIRRTEQTFFDLYARGLMAGTVHTSIGQEACAAGVVNALDRARDVIFSSHRAHGHFLAYSDEVDGLVAELLGRAGGIVGGVGGTQHLHVRNLYTNGVQGGIVPNAAGAALAEKLKQSGAIVVVFLGDGTMGQGVVYESMNLASLWSLPLLFVLEDNQYAQSTHRSQEHAGDLAGRAAAFGIEGAELEADDVFAVYEAASRAVDFVRANSRPYFLTLHTYRLAPHSKGDDTRSPEELERQWARDPLTLLAATLDAQRRDEINAAIETRIQAAVEKALADEPQAVDEFRAAGMKRLGDWRLEIGESQSPNLVLSNLQSPVSNLQSPISYLESLRTTLHAILDHDPAAVVLGEDILDPYGGAFKVMQGLSTRFPDRVLTTPICEASIVGMSVGMALRGLHPIAEIMFGDFVTLAADQIVNHAAKYPAMYNGQVSVPLVIRTPMGGGRGYGPTHSQSLERLFFGIPHLKLVAASHAHDAGALLQQAVADPEPVIFVENKLLYPLRLERGNATITREEAPDSHGYPVVTLRNYGAGESPDVTVIAYGGMSRLLVPLLERLADEEIRLLACLPACISPLDAAPLVAAARQSGRVLVVEESPVAFGWGAEVAAQISALAGDRLLAPVARLGAAPMVIPAAKALEDTVLPSTASIEAAIFELLTKSSL